LNARALAATGLTPEPADLTQAPADLTPARIPETRVDVSLSTGEAGHHLHATTDQELEIHYSDHTAVMDSVAQPVPLDYVAQPVSRKVYPWTFVHLEERYSILHEHDHFQIFILSNSRT
jgi:hypothetical protein